MNNKVILTEYQNKLCSFLVKNNRLLDVQCMDDHSKIGKIYIAKVKNIVKNLDACFVEIADKEICFLPFKDATSPFCLNRNITGSLVQGDEIVVQVTKEPLKTKQASVSCNITLQNNYFVFSAGNTKLGISSKLNKNQKEAIKNILLEQAVIDSDSQIIQKGSIIPYGMIVRTEAYTLYEQNHDLFLKELAKCHEQFLQIFEKARHRTCFSCIETSYLPYKDILSRFSKSDYEEVLTDLNEAYTALQDACIPVRLYTDSSYSIIKLYSLEVKLKEALNKTVWLKSGAYLVIEQTECLNTIDVNSGKKIKGNLNEESLWQINVEAAHEAALQIRLRNLSGIILIDFINMADKDNEQQLINLMRELFLKDPVTTNVIDITPLGLMEITRKKINKSLEEQFRGLNT